MPLPVINYRSEYLKLGVPVAGDAWSGHADTLVVRAYPFKNPRTLSCAYKRVSVAGKRPYEDGWKQRCPQYEPEHGGMRGAAGGYLRR